MCDRFKYRHHDEQKNPAEKDQVPLKTEIDPIRP
jgi:hypothetical protein